MTYFSSLQEMFCEQRDLFLKKTNADFEVLLKMLERKRTEMQMKIHETYDNAIKRTVCFKEGLQALYETLEKIKQAEIRVDID